VGSVRSARVRRRWVVAPAACSLLLLGLFPKFGAILTAIPQPVLGGASLAMFAMVAVVGVELLAKVNFKDQRNSVVVAASMGIGLFVTTQPGRQAAACGGAASDLDRCRAS